MIKYGQTKGQVRPREKDREEMKDMAEKKYTENQKDSEKKGMKTET